MRTYLVAYPWDLTDDDLEAVLDRLRGELGVTGLALWAAVPPVLQLRARAVEPRVVRSEGGLLFQPDDKHYVASRCKPVMAGWARNRDAFGRAVSACEERALEVRAVISASRTGRLAERHPDAAGKNLWGVASNTSICLANPDVQSYLCGLVADLSARWPLAGLVIRDFQIAWAEADSLEPKAWPPRSATRWLMALCFCESCRQRAGEAGVEVEAAHRVAAGLLQRSIDAGPAAEDDLFAAIDDAPTLSSFTRWRADELRRTLARIVDASTCDVILDRPIGTPGADTLDATALSLPAAVIGHIARAEDLPTARTTGAKRDEVRFPATLASVTHGPELVSSMTRAKELGFAAAEIDDFGLIPEPAFAPIKQAIRFARRTAEV